MPPPNTPVMDPTSRGRITHNPPRGEASQRRPEAVTHVIKLKIGENYTETLRERLVEYDISQGHLARQMGIQSSQLSRMFNRVNPPSEEYPEGKPMQPSLETVYKIEQAIIEILDHRRAQKRGRRRGRE
jgi:predicted transcriptional regulator